MRNTFLHPALVLVVVASLAGCAKPAKETTADLGSDSLIVSNPVEAPSGNLTPQQPYEPAPAGTSRNPARPPRANRGTAPPPASAQAPEASSGARTARTRPAPGVVVEWGSFLHVVVTDGL